MYLICWLMVAKEVNALKSDLDSNNTCEQADESKQWLRTMGDASWDRVGSNGLGWCRGLCGSVVTVSN